MSAEMQPFLFEGEVMVRVVDRNDQPWFVASVVANDPKLRAMLAILRAMSPVEADAWLEAGRRMVRAA